MIRTKDLVDMIRTIESKFSGSYKEYLYEIVARLRAYDKLKESIEKLLARVSNGVDKERK
jgi:hypothetical protein